MGIRHSFAAASMIAAFVGSVQPATASLPPPGYKPGKEWSPAVQACLKPVVVLPFQGKFYQSDGKTLSISDVPMTWSVIDEYWATVKNYSCAAILEKA